MTEMPEVAPLFAVLAAWAVGQGAEGANRQPGLWHGETEDWDVKMNPHEETIEGVDPFTWQCTHKTAFLAIAVVGVTGGCIIGPTEEEVIEHFRARTVERAAH